MVRTSKKSGSAVAAAVAAIDEPAPVPAVEHEEETEVQSKPWTETEDNKLRIAFKEHQGNPREIKKSVKKRKVAEIRDRIAQLGLTLPVVEKRVEVVAEPPKIQTGAQESLVLPSIVKPRSSRPKVGSKLRQTQQDESTTAAPVPEDSTLMDTTETATSVPTPNADLTNLPVHQRVQTLEARSRRSQKNIAPLSASTNSGPLTPSRAAAVRARKVTSRGRSLIQINTRGGCHEEESPTVLDLTGVVAGRRMNFEAVVAAPAAEGQSFPVTAAAAEHVNRETMMTPSRKEAVRAKRVTGPQGAAVKQELETAMKTQDEALAAQATKPVIRRTAVNVEEGKVAKILRNLESGVSANDPVETSVEHPSNSSPSLRSLTDQQQGFKFAFNFTPVSEMKSVMAAALHLGSPHRGSEAGGKENSVEASETPKKVLFARPDTAFHENATMMPPAARNFVFTDTAPTPSPAKAITGKRRRGGADFNDTPLRPSVPQVETPAIIKREVRRKRVRIEPEVVVQEDTDDSEVVDCVLEPASKQVRGGQNFVEIGRPEDDSEDDEDDDEEDHNHVQTGWFMSAWQGIRQRLGLQL